MYLIAHRGNINGKNKSKENSPSYILDAIKQGYDVEIDLWVDNDDFWLGHDEPQYKINIDFLSKSKKCKNISITIT